MAEEGKMQSRVTVKLDGDLLRRARARAEERGVSLSAFVEASVRAAVGDETSATFRVEDLPPITRSLCGCLKGARFDERNYADYLERKYR
ncbi:MAG: ribbon-helix-helix protein, CopG family [Planctomycetes bacterium]|nr:ribbon-helix-helix protein, CopG family [Planctomycetota bacterium]